MGSVTARVPFFASLALLTASVACGDEEFRVANRLADPVELEVLAPKLGIGPDCAEVFDRRFCAEEFESLGVLVFEPDQERTITVIDGTGGEDCADLLYLRILTVGPLGPVVDRGTQIQVPADVRIISGAGFHHTLALPELTVRIDEVGSDDNNQSGPPESCGALGRAPREAPTSDEAE